MMMYDNKIVQPHLFARIDSRGFLVFDTQPYPAKKKTIKDITRHIIQKTIKLGFDVFLTCSKKSDSRYLTVFLGGGRKVNIRISDHPANKEVRGYCDFDIYTSYQRYGAVDYIEFLEIWKNILKRTRQRRLRLLKRPYLRTGHLRMTVVRKTEKKAG